MPITSETTQWVYNGNSSATTFAYGQPIQSVNDLTVFLTDNTGTNQPDLVEGVDYQVNGVGDVNSANWSITYPIASGVVTLPTGWKITLNLNVPLVTNTNISTLTTSSGSVIQGAVDRLTLQTLGLQQQITDTQAQVAAGGVLSVNSNTGAVQITPTNIGALKASNNLSDVSNAATALTNLGGRNSTQVTAAILEASGRGLGSDGSSQLYWKPNIVVNQKTDTFSTTSNTSTDVTGLSVTITPSNTGSKIEITVTLNYATEASSNGVIELYRGAGGIGGGDVAGNRYGCIGSFKTITTGTDSFARLVFDTPNSTSPITYKVRVCCFNGTFYLNRTQADTNDSSHERTASTIMARELPV